MSKLSHIDDSGGARMVDVGEKQPTRRRARAQAFVRMSDEALRAVRESRISSNNPSQEPVASFVPLPISNFVAPVRLPEAVSMNVGVSWAAFTYITKSPPAHVNARCCHTFV